MGPSGIKSVHSRRYHEILVRLRRARQEAGLTQVEVADALGRPQSYVSKCESGERRIDVIELDDYAVLYRKALAYFFTGSSELSAGAVARERPEGKYRRQKRPGRRPR